MWPDDCTSGLRSQGSTLSDTHGGSCIVTERAASSSTDDTNMFKKKMQNDNYNKN